MIRAMPTRFCLVCEDSLPEETVRLLREACGERGVPFEAVTAKTFDFDPSRRLRAGDLLYNAATSVAASRAEQFLFAPGVATFHAHPRGVFHSVNLQTLLAEAAGIPMPKTVYLASASPELLRRQVERVGGFPVVLKVLGRSSGIGVMLAESMAALRSVADYAIAQGHNPLLCQFIGGAVHWRVIVLGGQAIASYRNKQPAEDFRSHGSEDREDFDARPPAAVVDAAVRATATMELEFAGVDVLEDPAGNAFFLEANFPCYYPHAQLYGGVDIAGAMVDFLLAKAGHAPAKPAAQPECRLRRLARAPDVFAIDDFADAAECAHVLAAAGRIERAPPPGLRIGRDAAGLAFEMPVRGDPVLARIMSRISRAMGMDNALGYSFRFRRYAQGQGHPPHFDEYQVAGRALAATAILYLSDAGGGETHFPHARPGPLKILPKRGRLALWLNLRADGSVDPAAVHESLAVTGGEKATITDFVYRPLGDNACRLRTEQT